MCGIAGIISKNKQGLNVCKTLVSMSEALKHRGPDDEGFLLVNKQSQIPYYKTFKGASQQIQLPYLPNQVLPESSEDVSLAFLHRRLSIIDLSPAGHQPMCDVSHQIWITFNGEIYNYKEIKKELTVLGYSFYSQTDTEVVLLAYKHWGTDCVKKFNGMWSFCIYDKQKHLCFASRDRLGVKPFYYTVNDNFFAFASEQKAFIKGGLISACYSDKSAANFLLNGVLENETENFFVGITELFPGTNLLYNLNDHSYKLEKYYQVSSVFTMENNSLTDKELIEKIYSGFEQAVKLRLRSDVPVGTCLSGGIDSSSLAVIMASLQENPVHCFTSIFRGDALNEEHFSDVVVEKIKGIHHKVEPTLEGFKTDLDALIYSQDVPIWSTSTYAQHKVMALARENNIKVVLDGQGADELFAGYHHHFIAKWNGLFKSGNIFSALTEIQQTRKSIANPFSFYLKEKLKSQFDFKSNAHRNFFSTDFIKQSTSDGRAKYFNSINEQLADDIGVKRLKIFLKCEDRAGMWHSVESRTPFSDDKELIKLAFSFNGNRKIQKGISKYILREAVKHKLPEKIYQRYDKMGFETPMKKWMQSMKSEVINEINSSDFGFLNNNAIEKADFNKGYDVQLLFKLFVLSRWKKVFAD